MILLYLNKFTCVLASDTDSAFVEEADAFLYLSIVPLTLQTIQATVKVGYKILTKYELILLTETCHSFYLFIYFINVNESS